MSTNFHDLIQGFHNFKANTLLQEAEFFDRLAHGQNPKTLVIACCDSRADPAILMGCKPGDLFVVRNVAALVPSEEEAGSPDAVLAAVEYAVKHLDIHHVIVMGHSNCGGIQGLLHKEKIANERHTSGWVALAQPVLDELEAENPYEPLALRCQRCEEGAVLLSIKTFSPTPGSANGSTKGLCRSTLSTTTWRRETSASGTPRRKTSSRPSHTERPPRRKFRCARRRTTRLRAQPFSATFSQKTALPPKNAASCRAFHCLLVFASNCAKRRRILPCNRKKVCYLSSCRTSRSDVFSFDSHGFSF